MSIIVNGFSLSNLLYDSGTGDERYYSRGFAVDSIATNVPGGSLTTGQLYRIVALGSSVNWLSIGASAPAVGITFSYNGTTITGSGGIVVRVRISGLSNVFTRFDSRRSSFIDADVSSQVNTRVYINGEQFFALRPNQIIRPFARYILLTGVGNPYSTGGFTSALKFNSSDTSEANIIFAMQGGGGGGGRGGSGQSGGGGGSGALVIGRTILSNWSTLTVGGGGSGANTTGGTGGNGQNTTLSGLSGGSTYTLLAEGGRGAVGGTGGAAGVPSTSGTVPIGFNSYHTVNGSAGGTIGLAGTGKDILATSVTNLLGSEIYGQLYAPFYYYFSTSGTVQSDNGAKLTRSGGLGGSSAGGGGGASHYANGGNGGPSGSAGVSGTRGSGGGGTGLNASGSTAAGNGGAGFIIIFK